MHIEAKDLFVATFNDAMAHHTARHKNLSGTLQQRRQQTTTKKWRQRQQFDNDKNNDKTETTMSSLLFQ